MATSANHENSCREREGPSRRRDHSSYGFGESKKKGRKKARQRKEPYNLSEKHVPRVLSRESRNWGGERKRQGKFRLQPRSKKRKLCQKNRHWREGAMTALSGKEAKRGSDFEEREGILLPLQETRHLREREAIAQVKRGKRSLVSRLRGPKGAMGGKNLPSSARGKENLCWEEPTRKRRTNLWQVGPKKESGNSFARSRQYSEDRGKPLISGEGAQERSRRLKISYELWTGDRSDKREGCRM